MVVGTRDALRLAVESERSDQRMSTLQHRITHLAVAAGATPNQRMQSFEALPTPVQQQARGAVVNTPRPQTNATPQIPWAVPQRRPERMATYAGVNANYALMQQQRSEHNEAAPPGPGHYQAAPHGPHASHHHGTMPKMR